jgi:hypothetical protein
VFFRLSTWELWLIIAGVVLGFVALGYLTGRVLRRQADTLREPVGIFDLDRPTRGLIRVPDAPLIALRASMTLPPAARGPAG